MEGSPAGLSLRMSDMAPTVFDGLAWASIYVTQQYLTHTHKGDTGMLQFTPIKVT